MDFSLYGELQSEIGSAADLWKLLNERFGQRNVNSRTAASSRLHAKRLGDTETFKEHITELRKLRSNLTESGGKITSEEWHSIILKSISEHSQWRSMVLYGSVIKEPEQLIMTLELQEDNGFINIYKPKEHTMLSTTTQSDAGLPRMARHRHVPTVLSAGTPLNNATHQAAVPPIKDRPHSEPRILF